MLANLLLIIHIIIVIALFAFLRVTVKGDRIRYSDIIITITRLESSEKEKEQCLLEQIGE